MKCECEECLGEGTITCPECDGNGIYTGEIQDLKLSRNMKNYDELIEFQKDAKRVTKQADRLIEMKPHRAESYRGQLRAALFVINAQAEKIAQDQIVSKYR